MEYLNSSPLSRSQIFFCLCMVMQTKEEEIEKKYNQIRRGKIKTTGAVKMHTLSYMVSE
jgi:hypothetical protein